MITSLFAPKKTSSSKTKRVRNNEDNKEASNLSSNDDTGTADKRQKKSSSQDVDDILSSLQDVAWKEALASTWDSSSFGCLASFVAKERRLYTIYPSKSQIWEALNFCRLDNVKVVIVGQDPYHGPGQAHGLCFSVLPGQKPPPSLNNIYKELLQDPAIPNFTQKPGHGHLIRWAKQGVLMLNTVMTVRCGQANSHQKKGWEVVTNGILRALHDKKCVFLLWGKPAAQKLEALNIIGNANNNNKSMKQQQKTTHIVISTSHPSPLGATKTATPFLGSRCFSRCNEELIQMGHAPIDWNIDGDL